MKPKDNSILPEDAALFMILSSMADLKPATGGSRKINTLAALALGLAMVLVLALVGGQ